MLPPAPHSVNHCHALCYRGARHAGGDAGSSAAVLTPGGPMRDPRTRQLAKLIVNHSCELQQGEAVLIESFDLSDGLVLDLVEETQAVGAIPVVSIRDNAVIRTQLRSATRRQLE